MVGIMDMIHMIFFVSATIEKLTSSIGHGEGPHWDAASQKLFFVDISGQRVLRLDPTTGNITSAYLKDGPVGVVTTVEGANDKLLVGVGQAVALVTWNGEDNSTNPEVNRLASLDVNNINNTRVNDGKCDPAGRFWIGTMALEINNYIEPNQGSLYRVGQDLIPKNVHSPVSVSNGLAWNSEKNTMYYIDSPTRQISAFDYDNNDGSISNKKVIFDFSENNIMNGVPDGMTIDADDNLWIAVYDGACVIQVDPRNGKLMRTIKLPADKITSVVFGGPQLDVLYVTSSDFGMTAEAKQQKPDSGSLFAVKGLGVRGTPSHEYKYTS